MSFAREGSRDYTLTHSATNPEIGRNRLLDHREGFASVERENRPLKLDGQVSIKPNRAMSLEFALVAFAACVRVLDVYTVRGLLLLVVCAALLVFLAANLALHGVLFHAAG